MGSPWYDCANTVRGRAGWRCECPGDCPWSDHADQRCEAKQDRPSPRAPVPPLAYVRERVRIRVAHRADVDCATPRPADCHDPDHYRALCTDCRAAIEEETVAVEHRAQVKVQKAAKLAAARERRKAGLPPILRCKCNRKVARVTVHGTEVRFHHARWGGYRETTCLYALDTPLARRAIDTLSTGT